MDYFSSKLADFGAACTSLEKALQSPYSDLTRDAAIQRFEFTQELAWKSLKIFLEHEGLQCNSPRSCFRSSKEILTLSEKDIENFLLMCDDRNLSVQTYSEDTANELYGRLQAHAELLRSLHTVLSKYLN